MIVYVVVAGCLELTLDNVCSLVSASDLLLLDTVHHQCQQYLLDNLHLDNVVTAGRLASVYRWVKLLNIYLLQNVKLSLLLLLIILQNKLEQSFKISWFFA